MINWLTRHERGNVQASGEARSATTEPLAVQRLQQMLREDGVKAGPDVSGARETLTERAVGCDLHSQFD